MVLNLREEPTSTMTTGRTLLLLAAVAALAAALAQARAAPLDTETCNKLLTEHGELEQAGVEADMAKGPEWAKANLIPEKLARIRRFIEIQEQLLFRCRQKSLVILPTEVEPEDKEQDKKEGEKTATTPKTSGPADKAKAPSPAAKKPAVKPAPKQTKPAPANEKAPAKAKAAAKQPAAAKTEPQPSATPEKQAPRAKAED
jgi:hypothetical protein